jgi:hypothetical protein
MSRPESLLMVLLTGVFLQWFEVASLRALYVLNVAVSSRSLVLQMLLPDRLRW